MGMEFRFRFDGDDPQLVVTTHPWDTGRQGAEPHVAWAGSRAEILMVDADSQECREGGSLVIEGDTATLRLMFQQIIELLDANDGFHREHKLVVKNRSALCPSCNRWNDPMSEWHGDGHGKRCYGLLEQRKALVAAEQPEPTIEVE